MTKEEMAQKIIALIRENVDGTEDLPIEQDTMLISSGYIDSFDIIQLLSVFEEQFQITISLDDVNLEDFDTVASMCNVILSAPKA